MSRYPARWSKADIIAHAEREEALWRAATVRAEERALASHKRAEAAEEALRRERALPTVGERDRAWAIDELVGLIESWRHVSEMTAEEFEIVRGAALLACGDPDAEIREEVQ